MGLFRSIGKVGEKLAKGIIDTVTFPFEAIAQGIGKVVTNGAKAATNGATESLFEKLEDRGLDQAFINDRLIPALDGVASIPGLVKAIKPWIDTTAIAGISLSYTAMTYLILKCIWNFYTGLPKNISDTKRDESIQDIKKLLENMEESSQFQTVILVRQLVVQHKSLRQQVAMTISTLTQERLQGMEPGDRERLKQLLNEAREIADSPPPILLSDKLINTMTTIMTPYLTELLAMPETITTTEELLDAVSANMNFESAMRAFMNQDFSQIKLTLKDHISFNYLNRISGGIISKIVSKIEEEVVSMAQSCIGDDFIELLIEPEVLYSAIITAQNLAVSNKILVEPCYKYNLSGTATMLAIQYRKIKNDLLLDESFIEYLNCNNNQVLIEQITTVILNRALLGVAVNFSKELNLMSRQLMKYFALCTIIILHITAVTLDVLMSALCVPILVVESVYVNSVTFFKKSSEDAAHQHIEILLAENNDYMANGTMQNSLAFDKGALITEPKLYFCP